MAKAVKDVAMSEQNPEQDQGYDKSIHEMIDSLEGVALMSKLLSFDDLRGKVYDSLAELAANMQKVMTLNEKATVDLDGVAEHLADVLKAMVQDGATTDDIVETTTRIMQNDSTERVDMMNGLLGEPEMVHFKPEHLASLITDCVRQAETTEQAIENIERIYHEDLADDVSTFIQLLVHKNEHLLDEQSKNAGQNTEQQTIEIKKDMKDHVSDIAKVALGVTIALAVDRLLHKKA